MSDLTWLFETDEQHGWRGSAALTERYAQPHRCQTESTAQREAQSDELMEELRRIAVPRPSAAAMLVSQPPPASPPSCVPLLAVASWYSGG
eukprot:CAMPEP_0174741770 /NCGR_PEP_ID=MMETSP1094-20130205/77177_1 /TAXON_ID=156173 /ORGANISM="Chrysochromulina brevifilum, Strain UTEX LB 985" /LENGTH=90 /DNA_ID=CAMNT_0015945713 /DNA_START=49 /DNA_END=317 /DNA_ORIENTATION=-